MIIKNDCNGEVDVLEKNSRKKQLYIPNVIKYFKTFICSQDTNSHNKLNINTKIILH